MPNHCHLVIKPYDGWDLENILGGMKSTGTVRVHAITGGNGPLWQQESYDRIVRDEEHLWRVVQYIGRNPHRANLPRSHWHRWLHPEWQAAGWRFEEIV